VFKLCALDVIMPRRNRIHIPSFLWHITYRCHNLKVTRKNKEMQMEESTDYKFDANFRKKGLCKII